MSKRTVELRYIISEELRNPPPEGTLSFKNILASYPIYKEIAVDRNGKEFHLRDELNNVIIEHFYFREIGFETVPRFLFKFNNKMNEIMPLYNQRFESTFLTIKPTDNVDMTETYEHTISGTGKTTSNGSNTNETTTSNNSSSNGDNFTVDSDTPNQELSEADIKANKFASKTNYNKGGNTTTDSGSVNNNGSSTGEVNQTDSKTESYTRREFGSSKGYTFAQNIEQWRNIMINVNMEIVKELEELFLGIW